MNIFLSDFLLNLDFLFVFLFSKQRNFGCFLITILNTLIMNNSTILIDYNVHIDYNTQL